MEGLRLFHLWTVVKIFLVFHAVTFAWIFFRAKTIADAKRLIGSMLFHPLRFDDLFIAAVGAYEFIIALIAIGFLEVISLLTRKDGFSRTVARWRMPFRFGVLYLLLLGILLWGQFDLVEFIYFQF